MVMSIGLAIGGNVYELRPRSLVREGADQAVGEILAV